MKLLFCAALIAFGVVSAAPQKMTLTECMDLALLQNPTYLSFEQSALRSYDLEVSSLADMLPSISVDLSGREDIVNNSNDSYKAGVSASYTVFNGGSNFYTWRGAHYDTEMAQLDYERQKQTLQKDVRVAWYSFLEAKAAVFEAKESLERLNLLLDQTKARYAEGMIWRNDILQTEVKKANEAQAMIAAQKRLQRAQAQLNFLMHRDLDMPIETDEILDIAASLWTYENAMDIARKKRRDLMRAEADLNGAHADVWRSRAAFFPTVTASGEVSDTSTSASMRDPTLRRSLELSMSWDIWSFDGDRRELLAAKKEVKRKELLYEQNKKQVEKDIFDAWRSLEEASEKVTLLRTALVAGEENYRVNTIRYNEQIGTSKDVLDAQDLLTGSRKDMNSALRAYLEALASLEYAIGL